MNCSFPKASRYLTGSQPGEQPRTGRQPTRAKTSDRSGVGIGLGSSRSRDQPTA